MHLWNILVWACVYTHVFIYWNELRSTLALVEACCLTTPGHYPNQCCSCAYTRVFIYWNGMSVVKHALILAFCGRILKSIFIIADEYISFFVSMHGFRRVNDTLNWCTIRVYWYHVTFIAVPRICQYEFLWWYSITCVHVTSSCECIGQLINRIIMMGSLKTVDGVILHLYVKHSATYHVCIPKILCQYPCFTNDIDHTMSMFFCGCYGQYKKVIFALGAKVVHQTVHAFLATNWAIIRVSHL